MTQSKAAPDNSQKWTSISSVNGPPPAGIPSAKWHRLQERTLQIGLDQESRYSRFHRQQATFAYIGNYFTDFSNRNSVFRGLNPGFFKLFSAMGVPCNVCLLQSDRGGFHAALSAKMKLGSWFEFTA
jgi:hypothetical protein